MSQCFISLLWWSVGGTGGRERHGNLILLVKEAVALGSGVQKNKEIYRVACVESPSITYVGLAIKAHLLYSVPFIFLSEKIKKTNLKMDLSFLSTFALRQKVS